MFASYTLPALVALLSTSAVRAIVTPLTPAPGDSFTAGQSCSLTWQGDQDSTSIWKGMSIELMSGSNTDMQHLTTVATNQDGTTSGTFSYTCPQVNPYSAIYFYQFSSPNTGNLTWTTRFTIKSPTGATTDPANSIQPDSGSAIPWGVGTLVDSSTAVAAPSWVVSASSNASMSIVAATSASSTGSTVASSTSSGSSSMVTVTSGTLSGTSAALPAANTSTATSTSSKSGALSSIIVTTGVWQIAALLASGMVFTSLL